MAPNQDQDNQSPLADAPGLLELVAPSLRSAFESLPPTWRDLTKENFTQVTGYLPTKIDELLRISLWRNYERVVSTGQARISNRAIYGHVLDAAQWANLTYSNSARAKERLAYMLIRTENYQNRLHRLLDRGLERLEELLSKTIEKPDGSTDVPLARVQLAATIMLDQRVNGAIVQRIDQRVLNANVDIEPGRVINQTKPEDIDKRIAELEQETKQLALQPGQSMPGMVIIQTTPEKFQPVTIHGRSDEIREAEIIRTEERDPKET
jgi:hypothetical protein